MSEQHPPPSQPSSRSADGPRSGEPAWKRWWVVGLALVVVVVLALILGAALTDPDDGTVPTETTGPAQTGNVTTTVVATTEAPAEDPSGD